MRDMYRIVTYQYNGYNIQLGIKRFKVQTIKPVLGICN